MLSMKISLASLLRSLFAYLVLIIGTCFCVPFFLPALLLSNKKSRLSSKVYFLLISTWSKCVLWVSGCKIVLRGKSNLSHLDEKPCVVVANHTSLLDAILLESVLGGNPRVWMVKHTLAHLPILGFWVRKMCLPVKRSDSSSAAHILFSAIKILKKTKAHFVLFPEGKRISGGAIGKFRGGFAIVASKLKRPIIPIFLSGASTLLPVGGALFNVCDEVTITVGKPIGCDDGQNYSSMVDSTQEWFVKKARSSKTLIRN